MTIVCHKVPRFVTLLLHYYISYFKKYKQNLKPLKSITFHSILSRLTCLTAIHNAHAHVSVQLFVLSLTYEGHLESSEHGILSQ